MDTVQMLCSITLYTPQRFLSCSVKSEAQYTLILFFSGSGRCKLNEMHSFESGDVLLASPGRDIVFTCEEAPTSPIAVLQFAEAHMPWAHLQAPLSSWIDSFLRGANNSSWLHLQERPLADLRALFHPLYEEHTACLPGSNALMGLFLGALLGWLARSYHFEHPPTQSKISTPRGTELVEYVKKIIACEFQDTLTLASMAQRCYVTQAYLSSLFKQKTNLTFTRYLNLTRISCARQLLLDTDELVVDIAVEAGFSSTPHFNLTFRSLTGFTPLEYRHRFKSYCAPPL